MPPQRLQVLDALRGYPSDSPLPSRSILSCQSVVASISYRLRLFSVLEQAIRLLESLLSIMTVNGWKSIFLAIQASERQVTKGRRSLRERIEGPTLLGGNLT